MTDSAIDARELPFPAMATKPGQRDAHAYSVVGRNFSIGILYASEPFNDDGSYGVHVSISYCKQGRPAKVSDAVLKVVQRLIEQQPLKWPQRYDVDQFSAGPFTGLGVHLWELPCSSRAAEAAVLGEREAGA